MTIKSDRKKAIAEANGQYLRCHTCRADILCQRGRMKLDSHIREKHPAVWRETYARLHEDLTDWEVPLA